MADRFSVASGAAGIVSLGLTVAKVLFLVADGIGSAGVEVRSHAEEIDAFSKLLNHVRIKMDECSSIYPDIQNLVDEVVGVCDKVMTPLRNLRETLEPLSQRFKRSPNKLKQLGLRIEWVFRNRSKVLFVRNALKQKHAVLDTTLGLILVTQQMGKDRGQPTISSLQIGIQNSIAALGHSYRANQQLALEAVLQNSLPEPTTRDLIADSESIYASVEASSVSGDSPETVVEYSVAASDDFGEDYSVAPPDDTGEELSEQDVLDALQTVVHGYDSLPSETVQEIQDGISALQRDVVRLAAHVKADADLETDVFETGQHRYEILLLCAGHQIYVAVRSFLDAEPSETKIPFRCGQTSMLCTNGRLGNHHVVVTYSPDADLPSRESTEIMLSEIIGHCPHIAMGLLVGFGDGLPSPERDIRLGDIVVSAPLNSNDVLECDMLGILSPEESSTISQLSKHVPLSCSGEISFRPI